MLSLKISRSCAILITRMLNISLMNTHSGLAVHNAGPEPGSHSGLAVHNAGPEPGSPCGLAVHNAGPEPGSPCGLAVHNAGPEPGSRSCWKKWELYSYGWGNEWDQTGGMHLLSSVIKPILYYIDIIYMDYAIIWKMNWKKMK